MNSLSGAPLDRCSKLRRDPEWLRIAFHDPAARILCYCNGEPLMRGGVESPEPILLSGAGNHAIEPSQAIFLGVEQGTPVFALDRPRSEDFGQGDVRARGVPTDFREIAAMMSRPAGALLAYGRALLLWHAKHPFCSVCGSPSAPAEGGHLRRCTNESCLTEHYPRTDPAVIMLVVSGRHCLLGRQAAWPANLYSTLAGFVEGGESLEEAVRREVQEEAGVEVGEVEYHSSQPWPFPSSLMIGFTGYARTREIRLNDSELSDARWFSREEIENQVREGSLRLPRPVSIARRMVEDWIATGSSSGPTD